MKILVFLPEEELAPKGGPLAVGYYYYEEMKKRGDKTLEFIHSDSQKLKRHAQGRSITKHFPKWLNNLHRTIRDIIWRRNFLDEKLYTPKFDFSKYDIIHFHQSPHFYCQKYNLENYKGIIVFQPHSPIPWSQETCQDLPDVYNWLIPNMKDRLKEVDRWCFDRADYIIFPCKEAEEPYIDNWPYFVKIRKSFDYKFRYLLTGIMPAKTKSNRSDILQQYGVPDEGFVITYVGRHNSVKGFDLLKEIAAQYLSEDTNAWVISAGLEKPFTRLKHSRWKEIGFTNDPHSLIAASDVFILPNRSTYFDIVMIEVLSLGKIVIASRTGGNKFFERKGLKGVLLYDTIDEAVALLHKVKGMAADERNELERENKLFYENHLSSKAMYDSYIQLLNDLYNNR